MKRVIGIVVCIWTVTTLGLPALTESQEVSVLASGETVIAAESARFAVRVVIGTHEVEIGDPTEPRPEKIRSSCTYSRYPCSLVDYIDISVNDSSLFVPRSVFCALADLNTAGIKIRKGQATLTLTGGDAGESYIVTIVFDSEMVRSRVLASGLAPDQALEKTKYHRVVIE